MEHMWSITCESFSAFLLFVLNFWFRIVPDDYLEKPPTMTSSKTYLQCHMIIETMEKIHVLSLMFQMKDPVQCLEEAEGWPRHRSGSMWFPQSEKANPHVLGQCEEVQQGKPCCVHDSIHGQQSGQKDNGQGHKVGPGVDIVHQR